MTSMNKNTNIEIVKSAISQMIVKNNWDVEQVKVTNLRMAKDHCTADVTTISPEGNKQKILKEIFLYTSLSKYERGCSG